MNITALCWGQFSFWNIFIVLRICTDTYNGEFANSIISGWKISEKRLQSYLRNKKILYTKEQN